MAVNSLSLDQKKVIVENIQNYYETERSESIGELAASQLVDFMISELGPYIYNMAIHHARAVMNEKALQMEDELFALEKRLPRNKS